MVLFFKKNCKKSAHCGFKTGVFMKYCMVIVTFADEAEADRIISVLLEDRLIACAQLQEIKSRYIWKGGQIRDTEVLAFLKTRAGLYETVEARIRELHSYEVPEIICVPVDKGLPEYLAWIDENTDDGKDGNLK